MKRETHQSNPQQAAVAEPPEKPRRSNPPGTSRGGVVRVEKATRFLAEEKRKREGKDWKGGRIYICCQRALGPQGIVGCAGFAVWVYGRLERVRV